MNSMNGCEQDQLTNNVDSAVVKCDSIDDREAVLRREMTVARRHCDCLVPGEFLDLFD